MKKFSYTFTVLRYVHDVTTGEFLNVGVAIYSPDAQFARAKCRHSYARMRCAFPNMNGEAFRSMARHIERRFDLAGKQLATELTFSHASSVLSIAAAVLPIDDSSLQWSPVGHGLTS